MTALERISIELTRRCAKACWFCYNHSGPEGATQWNENELVEFVTDCADQGVRAVSFGGGEPLEYDGLFDVLARLRGRLFRSLTTNGLLLEETRMDRLIEVAPDKVHISIHFPGNDREVDRVIQQVERLAERGIHSGINLLVQRSKLEAASKAAAKIRAAGISSERIVYLPMRGFDTPTPLEIAEVAGREPFQSMSCLNACRESRRFCSIAADKTVGWCSYTVARRPLESLTHAGLTAALEGLGLEFCGGTDDTPQKLVGLTPPRSESLLHRAAESRSGDDLADNSQLENDLPSPQIAVDDLPAAHSMDLQFFALDRNGCVGVFFAYLAEGASFEPDYLAANYDLKDKIEAALKQFPDEHSVLYQFGLARVLRTRPDGERRNWPPIAQAAYQRRELPPAPESLRDALLELVPDYIRRVEFPWLSFDDVPELIWPPQPPLTVAQWELLLDTAKQHWLATIDQVRRAQRQGEGTTGDLAHFERIADRQWSSLQQLEQNFVAWQSRKSLPPNAS